MVKKGSHHSILTRLHPLTVGAKIALILKEIRIRNIECLGSNLANVNVTLSVGVC